MHTLCLIFIYTYTCIYIIYLLPNFRYRGKELIYMSVFPHLPSFSRMPTKSVEKKTQKMQQLKNGQRSSCTCHLHPRKLTCPLKRDYFNRKYIFQPLIFRGHSLVFQGVPGDSRWNLLEASHLPLNDPKLESVINRDHTSVISSGRTTDHFF